MERQAPGTTLWRARLRFLPQNRCRFISKRSRRRQTVAVGWNDKRLAPRSGERGYVSFHRIAAGLSASVAAVARRWRSDGMTSAWHHALASAATFPSTESLQVYQQA